MNKDMNKNLKDTEKYGKDMPAPFLSSARNSLSYTKTHKLITALYMVTDIVERDEPIRNKLRTLGLEILSDTSAPGVPLETGKIDQVMSFLGIASAMNLISEMNCNILTKEFMELKEAVVVRSDVKPSWLEGFLSEPVFSTPHLSSVSLKDTEVGSKGHLPAQPGTHLGVQKGGTLMQALSDKIGARAKAQAGGASHATRAQFDILKKQRRDSVINIIKRGGGGATIKDIMGQINTGVRGTLTCSEKTLQRELMSMTKDGVLYKTGEKRWSRYSIKV